MTDQEVAAALGSWVALNARVAVATEAECEAILSAEKAVGKRFQYMTRVHSRLNRMRRERERIELKNIAEGMRL